MRAALFVDAGSLFSGGTQRVFGESRPRTQIDLVDPTALIQTITSRAEDAIGESVFLLRTYWYDGARNGIPDAQQVKLAELPLLKLRLGRVVATGQKGVDGLIILDLITLAGNRAIDVAVLLSGDEDLREAARHAQGYGVTLVLVVPGGHTSYELRREADHVIELDREELRPHLLRREDGDERHARARRNTPSAEEIERLCRQLLSNHDFLDKGPLGADGMLTGLADKMLVASLVDLTGSHPVAHTVLEKARAVCARLARANRLTAPPSEPTQSPETGELLTAPSVDDQPSSARDSTDESL